MMSIPVMDRYAKAWPSHALQPCPICTRKGKRCDGPDTAEPFTFEGAFAQRFDDDPHFTAYAPASVGHRLDSDAIGQTPIEMQLLVVDVEPAGHAPRTDVWDASEAPKIEQALACGAFFYSTRGGYRLIWRLAQPFTIASKQDAADWSASYLAALDEIERSLGIVGDRTCKDWTRLYRLPFVTRDGVAQEPETAGTLGEYALDRVSAPPVNTRLTATSSADDAPAPPEVIEAVRERLRRHGPAIEGKNGDQHTFEACAIVCRGWALSDEQACAVLDEWNQTCVPPWDADELRTKMDNAYNYGSGDIGEARSSWEAEQRIKASLERHLGPDAFDPAAKPTRAPALTILNGASSVSGRDLLLSLGEEPAWSWDTVVASWASLGEALQMPSGHEYPAMYAVAYDECMAYAGAVESTTDNVASERPFFESAGSMFASDDAPPAYLIERVLMKGGNAAISGEPKSAKTWLAIECALGVATGGRVLGKYKAEPGNVAYFFTEDMRAAIKTRVRALLAGQGKTPAAVARTFFAQGRGYHIDITRPEDCARIIASVRLIERDHGKVKLLVLDPLRNIHARDEDKSGEMMAVFECLKMIGKLLDTTVLLVHHAKKATQSSGSKRGGQKMRGSSAVHGFLDSGIYLDDVRINDDGTMFTNAFESEVKAARSAGKFELALTVEDDAMTNTARRATWVIGKSGQTQATPEQAQRWEDIGAAIVDRLFHTELTAPGKGMRATAIYDVVKGNSNAKGLALQWAVREGYVSQQKQLYRITPKGRVYSQEAQSRASEPTPPPEENDAATE